MKRRQFLEAAGIIIGGGYIGTVSAQVINMNDAINKSGRQRMLSQRLAKTYLQIGLAVDSDRSKKNLDASLGLFDRQLTELRAFSPNADNRAVLSDMEKTWLSYKAVLVGRSPNQQDARSIMQINEDILSLAQKATLQLEAVSGTSAGKLVNLSGRQRMLSQRMAKFYQAINWGVAPADAVQKLAAARTEFITSLAELNASPKNSTEIKRELELAQHQWVFFDNAIRNPVGSSNKLQLSTNVAMSSERILEVMDRITGLYQGLS